MGIRHVAAAIRPYKKPLLRGAMEPIIGMFSNDEVTSPRERGHGIVGYHPTIQLGPVSSLPLRRRSPGIRP